MRSCCHMTSTCFACLRFRVGAVPWVCWVRSKASTTRSLDMHTWWMNTIVSIASIRAGVCRETAVALFALSSRGQSGTSHIKLLVRIGRRT